MSVSLESQNKLNDEHWGKTQRVFPHFFFGARFKASNRQAVN